MKHIIILCASVLGVVHGVDTEGEKTLLVGVRPREWAQRTYYKQLAPNTQSWVLTDPFIGQNNSKSLDDYHVGAMCFSDKKVGCNGAKGDDLHYMFSEVSDKDQ